MSKTNIFFSLIEGTRGKNQIFRIKDELIRKLEDKVEDSESMLEQKKHEAKKLAKEVKKLKRLLDEEKMKAQRSQRFNRIMDHIDSID